MRKIKLFLTLLMLMCIGITQMWATDYQLVTSTDDLVEGANYVIGTSDGSFIATTTNNNNRKMTSGTITNNVVTATDAMMVFTLGGTSSGWTLYAGNYEGGAGYLNATSTTGSNNVKIVADLDKYAYFTIAITDAGVATVTCTGKTSRNILYRNGTTCFSCYNSQTQAQYVKPGLYKEVSAPTLSSIAVKTAPTTEYTEGDNFDPTGLVITGTYSDASTSDIAYAGNESDFSFSPTTSAALVTTDTKVTITYGGKSVDQAITVNAAACANPVAVAKGAETNGTYTLSATEVCGAGEGGVVFITDITPAEGYELDDITATVGSVDKVNNKVTGITANTEITVTFKELPKYTVSFETGAGNPEQASITEESYGAGITLPAGPTPKCKDDGWAFAGWAKAAVAEQTTTAPTLLSGTYNPEANNETLYAVYSKSEGGSSATTVTITPSEFTGDDPYTLVHDQSAYTITVNKNGGTKPAVNTNAGDARVYAKGTLVISNVSPMTELVFNISTQGKKRLAPITASVGTIATQASGDETVTWTGSATEVTFTVGDNANYGSDGSSKAGQLDFDNITATSGGGSTTYYLSAPSCCERRAITIADGIANGSVEADLAEACEGTTVTLTFTPATNYHLSAWTLNGEAQDVNENTFTMPATAVTVSATFEHDACQNLALSALDGEIVKTYNSATIVWGEVEHASSYLVSVIKNGAEEPIFSGSVTELSKALSDLEAETQYNYSIMAVGDGVNYCAEGNPALEGNFTTAALPEVKLTLMVGGAEDTDLSGNHTILTPFNLPNTASVAGCPKVFVGWDRSATCEEAPEYAPGAEFTFADETPATLYAVFAKEGAGQAITYPIDFEANADTYTDWAFNNMVPNYTNSGVTAHGGSKIGSTGGKATASVTTTAKIATPTSITTYVSKQSTNTSTSSWYVEVSTDNLNWTEVKSVDGASMDKGEWVELSADLSSYSNVYVRVYYEGSTAVRCIDDLVLSAVGPATYSEYSTECEACKAVSLLKVGEDQQKGNTFALKVGDDVVESVQTCEAASVNIVASPATGYQVSFGISELEGASLSENTISLAANTNGALTVTATFTQKNHTVTLAQNPAAGATLVGGKEDAHYNETINLSTDVPTGYEFINWTSESVEITNATSATGASFTMPDADVTVTANFGKVYTVSFNAGSDPITETAIGAGVELPAGPAPSEACVAAGWAFAGWAEAAVASETTDAQTLFNGEYYPTKDIELFAVYSRTESGDEPAETSYVKANYADLVSGDAIVITNDNYALSTVTASKGQPVATAVTVAEDVITSLVEGLVWDITKGEENFSLTVHGGTNKLYSTNTNNGLRIGTEDNYLFNITDNYLFNIGTSRYAGVYNSEDWRNYETINSNIENQTLAFYKAVSTSSSTTYYWSAPECCVPHNVAIADGIQNGSVVANPTSACADATITVTLTPAEGYELTAWTVDEEAQELTATTFTMPNKDVVVSATFSEIVTPAADATLKLMENGSEVTFEGNHKVGDVVTLPDALSDDEHACEGKVLKGWSTVEITTPVAAKPSQNFYELGGSYTIASEADVLYAVFAEEVPGETTTTNVKYAGSTTGNMDGSNQAALLVDATDVTGWSVVGAKGGNSNNVGLNKAGDIRLYYHANGGNTLTITAPQTITSVGLTFTDADYSNAYVEVGGEAVALTDGIYPINATSFVIGNANTSNVQVRIKKIEVNFTAAGSVANYATSCVAPLADPQFSVEGGEYTEAQTIELSAAEGTIYYTLDGKNPTSASTQYEAPIVLNDCGTTTIKAIAISATNHSEVVSETYTLNIPLPTNSELVPYSPTEARAVIDGSCYDGTTVMFVKGVVKSCTEFNANFGNYDVVVRNIGDETPEAPTFTYYHMYAASDKVKFTADEEITAGDTIVAAGVLTLYGTTYEFANNTCYMVEHKKYLAPKEHIANTQDDPYTIAQAIGFCDNAIQYDLTDEVYVRGVVTSINSSKTIIAHDPDVENSFQFYKANLNENEVGDNDTIIAKGTILKYNANTYEMNEGGLVVEVKPYVAPVVPEFTVNPTAVAFGNVEQNAQVDAIELNVELTAIANATVTLGGDNASMFSIDKETLTETGVVTVSVASTATVGNYAATITLHDVAEAAEDVVVNVTMNVTEVETRNIANGSAFTAVSGDLDPAHIKYAAFKGDGTTDPAINKSNIRIYKPASGKTTGGYLKLTALMGCTIDQVEITFNGQATASYAVNDAEFSDEAYITGETTLLTPTDLNAQSVSIVNLKNGSIDISAIKVYYIGSPLAVHHYILGGTFETTFEQNTEFSYEGLTVTAAYDELETITEPITDFTVVADLSEAGQTTASVRRNDVEIATYEITVTPGKANPNLAYMPAEQIVAAVEVGAWVAPELSNTLNVAPITYSTNKAAVATVDENGVIALAGGYGTAVITAHFEGDENYIASEATYTITITEPVNKIAGKWMVAGAEDIKPGVKVIVVGEKSGTMYAMGAQNTNNRAAVAAQSIVNDTLYAAEGTKTFILVDAGEGLYAFQANNGMYLYAASNSSNQMKEQATLNDNGKWSIAIANDGEATIQAQGSNSRNLMSFNNSGNTTLFSCYGSKQSAIKLYVNRNQIDGSDDPANPAEVTINDNVVEDEIVANGNVVVTVNTDNIEEPKSYIAQNGATIIITGTNPVAKNVVVEDGSRIEASVPTTTPNVYFATTMGSTQTPGTASELGSVTNITLATGGEIIYDLTLGTSMAGVQADPNQWHAFTLPFAVDALNGIYDAVTGEKLENEVNYAIMDYHGDIRANGQYGWKKYRGILQPGVFYIMTVDGNTKTFRFKASKVGAMTQTTSMGYTAYNGSGASSDYGWNGIGNPSWISATVEVNVQVLDPYTYTYQTLTSGTNLTVSTPFFYNAGGSGAEGSIVMQEAGTGANYAPARTQANEIKNVAVSFGNEVFRDKLYISASEDALNEYEQDKDLVRMIMSSTPKVAQIFGNAYGMKLSIVNAPMSNDKAEYSLTLYAPNAGEYTISAQEMEDADLYLTQNGSIIWNLSMSEYVADFAKGNNEGYGLLLVKKAPGIATGVDSAEANEAGVQKVIIEDKVFILRGGQMYDVTGKMVK